MVLNYVHIELQIITVYNDGIALHELHFMHHNEEQTGFHAN